MDYYDYPDPKVIFKVYIFLWTFYFFCWWNDSVCHFQEGNRRIQGTVKWENWLAVGGSSSWNVTRLPTQRLRWAYVNCLSRLWGKKYERQFQKFPCTVTSAVCRPENPVAELVVVASLLPSFTVTSSLISTDLGKHCFKNSGCLNVHWLQSLT